MRVQAPAKINLSLRVTGQKEDGYHTLSSFVTFAAFGDVVELTPADKFGMRITGPFAEGLTTGPDNLCVRAFEMMECPPVSLTLTKNIPVAAGLGGGSSDAAATIRGLIQLYDLPWGPEMDTKLLSLGADVPVCFAQKNCHMSGIGEVLKDANIPAFPMLLVNPLKAVSTVEIFKSRIGAFSQELSEFPADMDELTNDLTGAAVKLLPDIGMALDFLEEVPGVRLARMSGSGATCFALFDTEEQVRRAEVEFKEKFPGWWSVATKTLPA